MARNATCDSEIVINGATLAPSTSITGPLYKFEQNHSAEDKTGKSAIVGVNVSNAPNGLTYRSHVLPGEGKSSNQPCLSAEQWLTVPNADSIKATESASYGSLSADVGIDMVKDSLLSGSSTIIDYYGKAYASATQVDALHTAEKGSAESIHLYGQAKDKDSSFSIDTSIKSLSGSPASFNGLKASSSAGATTHVTQQEHINGEFTSTAKAGKKTKTRTSNYGNEYDLNMQLQKYASGPSLSGRLGYYVDINNPLANRIQDAVMASDKGDSINVAPGIYLENIQIDKCISVNGSGRDLTIIDGNKEGSVFTIGRWNSDVDVILSGMTIKNGANDYGAGIWNKGKTSLVDVNVSGNTANYDGGGINNRANSQLIIKGASDISGNTAGRDGGGIINGGVLELYEIDLSENVACAHGGGFFNYGSVTMAGGNISYNTAKANNAGGIANYGYWIDKHYKQAKSTISGTSIYSNYAGNWGGGIDNDGILILKDSTLTGNKASYGGGIHNGGNADVGNCTFSGNIAGDGGGILNDEKMIIKDSIISGNEAEETDGGGIANFGYYIGGKYHPAELTVSGTVVSSNSAARYGGGIISDGIMSIKDSTLSNNKAAYGGGFHSGGDAKISNTIVSGNNADYGAGIWNTGITTIEDIAVLNNTAVYDGGGIINRVNSQLTIQGPGNISGNSAGRNGGGISNGGMLKLDGINISGNIAVGSGGGFFNYGSVKITGGSISNNTAKNDGGGAANYGYWVNGIYKKANFAVSGTMISHNNAGGYGGGFSSDGLLDLSKCTIKENNAKMGAGIYNGGSLKSKSNKISGNIASLLGGGLYNDGKVAFSGDSISSNIAKGSGGGIYNANSLYVNGATQIENNRADRGYGGGVYSYSETVTLSGKDVTITGNKAQLPSYQSDWYRGSNIYLNIGLPKKLMDLMSLNR